jgi:5-methylcytosine-specific restriction endonuclease McrA
MRGFQKGHIGYNKGKILVEYNCQDCGKRVQKRTKRCRKCYAKTQIGKVSYVYTEEIRKKLSTSHIGKPSWNTGKKLPQYTGENAFAWKGGITSESKLQRVKFRNEMQKLIFERDNYTCQMCGAHGVDLQVDHIQPWADYVEGRFDMNNCRTLCVKCHFKITFGREMSESVETWGRNLKESLRVAP